MEETGPVLNTASAELTVTPYDSESTGLEVVSSNLVTSPSTGQWFERWYLVLENKGSLTLCYVQAEGEFRRGGVTITDHYGFADAPAYAIGSALSAPCLAPGDRGVLYTNGFASENYQADSIDELSILVVGSVYEGAVVHPSAPTITSSAADWRVTGTATANGTIYNLGMDVYPYDASGLVFDRLMDFHLDTLFSAEVWNYETTAATADFSEYEQYVDFIEGAASFMIGPQNPEAERLSELKQQRDRHKAQVNDRLAAFERASE